MAESDRTESPTGSTTGSAIGPTPDPRGSGADISGVRFLTVAEVASVMRVSKMTVYRLVHSGELPAVRVGRSFRVPENDVHAYLQRSFFQAG
jgi:excisionase family DNA binding protein